MLLARVLCGLVVGAVVACAPAAVHPVREAVRIPLEVNGARISLEGFVHRPAAPGKHGVVILSHGSSGENPKASLSAETQSAYFVAKGFIVVVPMRRGRGQSDGVSLEGELKNCDVGSWESGLQAAYADITAAIDFAATLPDADASRVLLGGVSRGGFLSVAYAAQGARRDVVVGVINFSGGWVAQAEDNCPTDFNEAAFRTYGMAAARPQLWLYGEADPFYARNSILNYREAFESGGGTAHFDLIAGVPGNGHLLADYPELWREAADKYFSSQLTP